MDAQENELQHPSGWLFMTDYSIFGISCIFNTVLAIIWIKFKYGYVAGNNHVNLSPSQNSTTSVHSTQSSSISNSKVKPDVNSGSEQSKHEFDSKIEKRMMSETTHKIPFFGHLYITISIVSAVIFSYFCFTWFTLRKIGYLTLGNAGCMVSSLIMIPYGGNRSLLYIYFIWRVHISFNSTILEIKKNTVKLLSVAVVLTFICAILCNLIYLNVIGCEDSMTYTIAGAPFVLVDQIWAWLCLYLFVSRLRKLFKIAQDKNKQKEKQRDLQKLKYLANKLTILALVAVTITVLMLLVNTIVPLLSLSAVDTTLNVICLMLSCAQYDLYFERWCILCRMCCEKTQKVEETDSSGDELSTSNNNNVDMILH